MAKGGSLLKTITIPYTPHQKQYSFHRSKAKFRALITGVGFGKTAAGANELVRMAVTHPKEVHVVMAPNTKILKHATLPELYKFCRPLISHEKKSMNTIYLFNGAKIIYLTADNQRHIDRLRGITIGSAWLDEAALFLPGVWNIIIARLRGPTGPLRIIITTTPKGFDWIYSLFVKKVIPGSRKKLPKPEDYEWFGGTTMDNPFTPQEFKDTLLMQYDGVFRQQEIYGEFVGFEGAVYKNFRQEINVIGWRPLTAKIKEYIFGLDWGFSNPMACLIIGLDGDGRAYVLEEFYERGVQIETVMAWLKEKNERYHFSVGYADPSEPQFILKLQEANLPVTTADNEIMPGIDTVFGMIGVKGDGKPRLFVHKSCIETINEFGRYRYKETAEGTPKQDNPLKVDDHLMDALRYALHTHNGGSSFIVFKAGTEEKDNPVF